MGEELINLVLGSRSVGRLKHKPGFPMAAGVGLTSDVEFAFVLSLPVELRFDGVTIVKGQSHGPVLAYHNPRLILARRGLKTPDCGSYWSYLCKRVITPVVAAILSVSSDAEQGVSSGNSNTMEFPKWRGVTSVSVVRSLELPR